MELFVKVWFYNSTHKIKLLSRMIGPVYTSTDTTGDSQFHCEAKYLIVLILYDK